MLLHGSLRWILKGWLTVKKPHQLITGRMNLQAREQDIITLLVKSLKSENDKNKFSDKNNENESVFFEFKYYLDSLIDHFNLTRQGLYKALYDGTKVMGRVLEIKDPKKGEFEKTVVISKASFKDGVLFIRMDKDAARYLLDYSSGFSEIDLNLLLSLRGAYEKRILELISRFKDKKDYSVTLDEFCKMLGVSTNDYVDFPRFRRSTLINPIKNIVIKSNGSWCFRDGFSNGFIIEKKGRSYKEDSKITFKLNFNELNKKITNVNKKIKPDDERYKFIDYLADKIEADEASNSEAEVFLSLADELDISYSDFFIEKSKKIANGAK